MLTWNAIDLRPVGTTFKYVIVLPNNLTATGIILQYWRPDINVSVWIVVFGVCIIAVNVRNTPPSVSLCFSVSPCLSP